MAYSFTTDDAAQVVSVAIHRPLTLQDWGACVARQIAEGAWRFGTIYDFTHPLADFPASERQQLPAQSAQMVRELGPRGPVALVASDDARYAAMEAWVQASARLLPYSIEVFRNRGDAERWLQHHDKKARA